MSKKKNLFAFSLMIVCGIILIVVGIINNNKHREFMRNYKETTGTVIGYTTSHDDGDEKYKAKYKYEVNGETYSVTAHRYQKIKPRDGETDTVYYNPDNPEEAKTSLRNSNIVVIGTGVFLIIAGVFVLITIIKRK